MSSSTPQPKTICTTYDSLFMDLTGVGRKTFDNQVKRTVEKRVLTPMYEIRGFAPWLDTRLNIISASRNSAHLALGLKTAREFSGRDRPALLALAQEVSDPSWQIAGAFRYRTKDTNVAMSIDAFEGAMKRLHLRTMDAALHASQTSPISLQVTNLGARALGVNPRFWTNGELLTFRDLHELHQHELEIRRTMAILKKEVQRHGSSWPVSTNRLSQIIDGFAQYSTVPDQLQSQDLSLSPAPFPLRNSIYPRTQDTSFPDTSDIQTELQYLTDIMKTIYMEFPSRVHGSATQCARQSKYHNEMDLHFSPRLECWEILCIFDELRQSLQRLTNTQDSSDIDDLENQMEKLKCKPAERPLMFPQRAPNAFWHIVGGPSSA